ncbi:MAG: 3D domain-containing protein [Candidatus Paceibacterota bacterium]
MKTIKILISFLLCVFITQIAEAKRYKAGKSPPSTKSKVTLRITYYSHDEPSADSDTKKFRSKIGEKLKYPDQNGGLYHVAVDRNIIPLGKKLRVEDPKSGKSFVALAVDTGGAVIRRIDVFSRGLKRVLPSENVNVYVL